MVFCAHGYGEDWKIVFVTKVGDWTNNGALHCPPTGISGEIILWSLAGFTILAAKNVSTCCLPKLGFTMVKDRLKFLSFRKLVPMPNSVRTPFTGSHRVPLFIG
jgi:hypothetical protein